MRGPSLIRLAGTGLALQVPITTMREIKLLKALNHPNVVPVEDMVLEAGASSLVSPSAQCGRVGS